MLLLATTASKLQVVTGAAVVNTMMHASWVDNNNSAISPGALNLTVATAATTDLVPAPAASTQRNIGAVYVKNTNASTANTITIQLTDGTNVVPLWSGVLQANWSVKMDEFGNIQVFTGNGVPVAPASMGSILNTSVASQGPGFAADTYLVGSSINIPVGSPKVGTKFRCKFAITKTAAGTATPIITIRFGAAGTTADAAVCTFTYGAGTAAVDTGVFEVTGIFRTVGAGTSAILQASCQLDASPTTGFASTVKSAVSTSAGFNSTLANAIIGISVNGGTSAAWTAVLVETELTNL